MSRPCWDEYFFEIMHSVAKRATCDRGRSGCVIVKDNRILSTGYVGAIAKAIDCDNSGHVLEQRRRIIKKTDVIEDKDVVSREKMLFDENGKIWVGKTTEHCIRTIHAEMNAILYAAKSGVALDGSTLYCTMTPCRNCAMAIISVGIKQIHCEKKYHCAEESEEMFKDAKIQLFYKTYEVMTYDNDKTI